MFAKLVDAKFVDEVWSRGNGYSIAPARLVIGLGFGAQSSKLDKSG